MNKQEFEERLGTTVSDEEWEKINYVYTWHPSISHVNGKDDIAKLYKIGGPRLMIDMISTAKEWERLENLRADLKLRISKVEEMMNALARGEEIDRDISFHYYEDEKY